MLPGYGRFGGALGVTGSSAWTPLSLGSTLRAWYHAERQVEADTAQVTTLVDQTGNGFNFTKPAAQTNGPVMLHNYVNGKKAIYADAGRSLECSPTLLDGATAATMMMVVNCYADPTGEIDNEGPVQGFTTAAQNKAHFFIDGNIYENFASSSRRSVNPSTTWAAWRIYGVTSAANDWKLWYDGTAIISDATNTVNTGSTTRRLFDADAPGVGEGNWKGDMAELIFCDTALSTSDRQKLEGYFAHQYGLTANLPGGHPYISSPP